MKARIKSTKTLVGMHELNREKHSSACTRISSSDRLEITERKCLIDLLKHLDSKLDLSL